MFKRRKKELYTQKSGRFRTWKIVNGYTLAAFLSFGLMFPVIQHTQSTFAANENTSQSPTVATASNANAQKMDIRKIKEVEKKPDGFFADKENDLCYRKNGITVKDQWFQKRNTWYYATDTGKLARGWRQIDNIWYYFSVSGRLKTGWLFENGDWYYLKETGMETGYQEIDGNEFYFHEDGKLAVDEEIPDGRMADKDGYLFSPEEEFPTFTYDKDQNREPGELSGIRIAEEPVEFFMLSIAGETSGGQIIMGDRGRAYGLCQLDYRYDLTDFIRWAYQKHPRLWPEFESFLSFQNNDTTLIGNEELRDAFAAAADRSYEGAVTDQLEFMRMRYWNHFHQRLNDAGFDLDNRHIAVSAAMFSVNVNCGSQPDVFISNLSPEMSDAEMICRIYQIRNTILAEQMVGQVQKGTTGRYRMSEPEMALDLLYGYTTIDTVRSYGHGVQWNGNIFHNSVTTQEIQGKSEDWQAFINEQAVSENSEVSAATGSNAIPDTGTETENTEELSVTDMDTEEQV